jgi:hypothetical protein
MSISACGGSGASQETGQLPIATPNTQESLPTQSSGEPTAKHMPIQTETSQETSRTLFAVNFSLAESYPLRKCMEFATHSQIEIISMVSNEIIASLVNQGTGYYFPRWHPFEEKIAFIEIDYSESNESSKNSEFIRTFPGDQIGILTVESTSVASIMPRLERTELLSSSRRECNSMQGVTRLDGWSPDGVFILYRFYGRNLLGEQFAIVNINTGEEKILGRDMGNFDWVRGGDQIISLNVRERVFSLFDTNSGGQIQELPLPPTSSDDWLPLMEWNEITGTFISDAPSSSGTGTSFWLWNDQEDDWEEQTIIPSSYPVQTWDTHSSTTIVCNSGDQGAELLVMDTKSLTFIERYTLPPDIICKTMDRSIDQSGREIVAFLQERSSIFIIAFNGDGHLTREIDLSEYIYQLDIPQFETTETFKPFWIDLYP